MYIYLSAYTYIVSSACVCCFVSVCVCVLFCVCMSISFRWEVGGGRGQGTTTKVIFVKDSPSCWAAGGLRTMPRVGNMVMLSGWSWHFNCFYLFIASSNFTDLHTWYNWKEEYPFAVIWRLFIMNFKGIFLQLYISRLYA